MHHTLSGAAAPRRFTVLPRLAGLCALLTVLTAAAPAAAQVTKTGISNRVIAGGEHIGNDLDYDPAHQVHLVVSGYGVLRGVFTNTAGVPVTPQFQFGSANASTEWASYPRVQFVQQLNGGQGAFLVAWAQSGQIRSIVIAYPSGIISAEQVIGVGASGGMPAIAYSATSARFLVAWHGIDFGMAARMLDASGTPIGVQYPLAAPQSVQKPGPSIAWNAATNEFGLTYASWSGSAGFVVFQRLGGASGAPVAGAAPVLFGQGAAAYCPEIAVNSGSHTYVVGWTRQVGAGAMAVQFSAAGAIIAGPTLVSTRFGSYSAFDIAFNPTTGTFLAVAEDNGGTVLDIAAELNGAGTPVGAPVLITDGVRNGSFSPRVAARTNGPDWNISFSMDYSAVGTQIATSGGGGGGNPPPPPPPPPASNKPDITVYRPSLGMWYTLTSASGWTSGDEVRWGLRGDVPLQGDFDGDRRPDLIAYRPSTGVWDVLFSSAGYATTGAVSYQWGAPGDIPVPGDYTGDGKTDLAIWRPANGAWYIFDVANQRFSSYQWGISTDKPVTADFDRDGKSDIAVFRPSTGYWYIVFSSNLSAGAYLWGGGNDVPLPGDYSGDGHADIAVYRPSTGVWYVLNLVGGSAAAYQWGDSSYMPAPRDYDGDGRTDLAIFRPSTGSWYIYFVGSNTFGAYSLGLTSDIPIR